jgi:DNA invertase Pin-like site-specific DNA recombinase
MMAYGYSRVSTFRQAKDGDSLPAQESRIAGYCQQEGLELSRVYVEAGVSGATRFRERPQGGALLGTVQPGDVIVSTRLDRCFRSAADALEILEYLKAKKIGLALLDMGGDVCSGGVAGLIFGVLAAVSNFERIRISERIVDVKTMARNQGRFLGGVRPFGYQIGEDKMLVPDPAEQAALLLIVKLASEGRSLRAIQASVSDQFGFRLSHTSVQRVLRDARASKSSATSVA